MARIIFVVVALAAVGAGGWFVAGGLFPPQATPQQVTHDVSLANVVGK
jgi:hypothetical protein